MGRTRHILTSAGAIVALGMLVGCTAIEQPARQARLAASTQQMETLSSQDHEAVTTGWPQEGMSATTLRALWGDPYYTEGRTGHYEQWFYLGSAMSLGTHGNAANELGTMVVVELRDSQVLGWSELVPTHLDTGGSENNLR